MKRKTVKKIASLLALTLTATAVFAGCGKKDDTKVDASKSSDSSVESSKVDDAAEPSEEVVEKSGKIKVMVYDRATMASSEGDLNNNRWTEWIRENSPLEEIEFVAIPKTEGYETMSLQFAGGDGPDLYPNTEARLTEFVTQGVAMEITDEMLDKMPNYKALLEEYPALVKNNSRNGKLYGFGVYSTFGHNHTMVVREDWMENLGISTPTTVDEFYDMLYAFTYNDPDGNGVNDTWGINMTTDAMRVTSHMFGFGNPEKYKFDENGNFVYAWDNIEAWLTFARKCVDNKLVNPDFMTMKADDDQADFLNSRIGVYCSGRFTNANRYNLFKSVKEQMPETAKITTFALPDAGFGVYTANANSGIATDGFISTDCKDLDATLAYVNWLYDPDTTSYLTHGPEGEYYERNEYGTWFVVDSEKNSVEFDYRSDYILMQTALQTEADAAAGYSPRANDEYNQALSSDDPIRQEFGILNYKFMCVANQPEVTDPRVYLTQGKPALPDELALSATTADTMVNDLLKAGVGDSSKSVADVIAEAKATWEAANGAEIDAWYANYYATEETALLPSDFLNLKVVPEMTPLAAERAATFGFVAE